MNTSWSPSRYSYCISFFTRMARPTFSSCLKVRSRTAPVFRLRSLVRTTAWPFPGLWCRKSRTVHSWPSSSRVIPFFRSLVETLTIAPSMLRAAGRTGGGPVRGSQDHEVPGGPRHGPAAGLRDLHHVLDAHAPQAGDVHARLDRDHRPDGEDVLGLGPQGGSLVDLQPHAVPQRMGELLAPPGLVDDRPRRGVGLAPGDARLHGVDAGLLGGLHQVVDLPELLGGLAVGHRPRHVRVAAPVQRAG